MEVTVIPVGVGALKPDPKITGKVSDSFLDIQGRNQGHSDHRTAKISWDT